jgi:pimeloyl-ACP methyl ester carboxylesterase
VIWLWLGLGIVAGLLLLAGVVLVFHFHVKRRFMGFLVRVFQERPFFIVPRGEPVADAEDVQFPTTDGLTLRGCYLHTTAPQRQGVILFGLEFGSNRWACVPYCQFLLDNGFDVFAFEFRGQGDSDPHPGYEPLQWVTDYEVHDVYSALAYLQSRSDADPKGVGFFGISKGGSAGVIAASRHPYVRCCVTDGIFATHTTMVPYMRKWVGIVSKHYVIQNLLPTWYYNLFAHAALQTIRRQCGCRFPHLERAVRRLSPRPLLMIHGQADTYIKPEMAQALFAQAQPPKELWIVEGAKHNQALSVAAEEYQQRVLAFFQTHLAQATPVEISRTSQPVFPTTARRGLPVSLPQTVFSHAESHESIVEHR